jgi:hypothetical protein
MFIPDPDFYPSQTRIPDPNTATKERSEKNLLSLGTFLCSHKFHKIENYFIFEIIKKKIGGNFQKIIEFFTHKIVTGLSKIWVWDPGSGKTYSGSRIPNPGVKKAPAWIPGSGYATLVTSIIACLLLVRSLEISSV